MEYTFYDNNNDILCMYKSDGGLGIRVSDYSDFVLLSFDKERIPDIVAALNNMYGNTVTVTGEDNVDSYEGGGVRQKEDGKARIDLVHMSFVHDVMDYWSEGRTIELINAMKGTELSNYDPVQTAATLLKYEFGEYVSNNSKNYYRVLGNVLKGLGDTMTYGAITQGYGERNWEKMLGDDARQRYGRSLLRHMSQHLAGDTDEPHFYRALFNCMGIWYWNKQNGVELW